MFQCRATLDLAEIKDCAEAYKNGNLNMTGCGPFGGVMKLLPSPTVTWLMANISFIGKQF